MAFISSCFDPFQWDNFFALVTQVRLGFVPRKDEFLQTSRINSSR